MKKKILRKIKKTLDKLRFIYYIIYTNFQRIRNEIRNQISNQDNFY